jgi:hypothetical protein
MLFDNMNANYDGFASLLEENELSKKVKLPLCLNNTTQIRHIGECNTIHIFLSHH